MKHLEPSFEKFLTESYARFRELPPVSVNAAWDRVLSRLDREPYSAPGDPQVCLDSARPLSLALEGWPVLVTVAALVLCAIGVSLLPSRSTPALVKRGNDGLYQAEPQQFDAASIRLSIAGDGRAGEFNELPGGRVSVVNGRLRRIIMEAYGVTYDFQLIGGPNWINSTRYDIQATAGAPIPPAQLKLMLQRLLEERFQMKAHRETRELPVYLLTVAKSGSKLQQSTEGGCALQETNDQTIPRPTGASNRPICGQNLMVGGRWDASRVNIARITEAMTYLLDRIIINKTDLSGFFDVHIEIPRDPLAVDTTGPSFFTIIEEQLGLKLVPDRGPVEVLVIDQIERPSEN